MQVLFRLSRRFVFLATLVALFALLFSSSGFSFSQAKPGGALRLQMPEFAAVAHAQGNSAAASIANEAGIAAYFQQPDGIDLSGVRGLYRTIEADEESYIIGSMQVRDYDEKWDVHVYVSTDGWVLAYYPKDDPASKIVDMYGYDGVVINTTLEVVLEEVANAVGLSTDDIGYYDFRYPNATGLTLIGTKVAECNDRAFKVTLPSSYTFFERSWAHTGRNEYNRALLNESEIVNGSGVRRGTLTGSDLAPERTHEFRIVSRGYCYEAHNFALALIYQEGE